MKLGGRCVAFVSVPVVVLGAVVMLSASPARAAGQIAAISPELAFNNQSSVTLVFTTQTPMPPQSAVVLTRAGTTDDVVLGDVDPDSSDPFHPRATLDFTDEGTGADDGPADPGVYSAKLTQADTVFAGGAGASDSCSDCFTVFSGTGLTVSGATPNLAQGGSANVTVTGTGFAKGTRIDVLLSDGTIDPTVHPNLVPVTHYENDAPGRQACAEDVPPKQAPCDVEAKARTTATAMLRRFMVDASSPPGPRGLRVENTDGVSAQCNNCFSVNGGPLRGVSPSVASNDPAGASTQRFTFSGTGLASGTPVLEYTANPGSSTRDGLSLEGQNVVFSSDTSVSADFDVRSAAPGAGSYQPVLRQQDGSTNTCSCRVSIGQSVPPSVKSLQPASAAQGQRQTLLVGGVNFSRGVLIAFSGTGITVTAVEFVSPTQLNVTVQLANDAAVTARDVTATSTDSKAGAVCSNCFTVQAGAPASATPTATPTATMAPAPTLALSLDRDEIVPTQPVTVTVSGRPAAGVELWAYSRPSTSYAMVRSGTTDASGRVSFSVTPGTNTRLYAAYQGGPASANSGSQVIMVHTALSLSAYRDGVRRYHFQGRNLPRLEGQLITLYRIESTGVETRTATTRTDSSGIWRIDRLFTGSSRFTFVARTSQTLTNASGRSNERVTVIY